jgi:hypothetical protein
MGTRRATMGYLAARSFRYDPNPPTTLYLHLLSCTVTRVPEILKPYHRSLALHIELVDKLRSHSIAFESSREIINSWIEQPWLEDAGWQAVWEDICGAEIERW